MKKIVWKEDKTTLSPSIESKNWGTIYCDKIEVGEYIYALSYKGITTAILFKGKHSIPLKELSDRIHASSSQGRGESSDERGQARAESEGGESAEL